MPGLGDDMKSFAAENPMTMWMLVGVLVVVVLCLTFLSCMPGKMGLREGANDGHAYGRPLMPGNPLNRGEGFEHFMQEGLSGDQALAVTEAAADWAKVPASIGRVDGASCVVPADYDDPNMAWGYLMKESRVKDVEGAADAAQFGQDTATAAVRNRGGTANLVDQVAAAAMQGY